MDTQIRETARIFRERLSQLFMLLDSKDKPQEDQLVVAIQDLITADNQIAQAVGLVKAELSKANLLLELEQRIKAKQTELHALREEVYCRLWSVKRRVHELEAISEKKDKLTLRLDQLVTLGFRLQ